MSEQIVGPCPYRGLVPYGPEDTAYFFGRERERQIIRANLVASRLTVLYGASGAGKTSVLCSGVIPDLEALARSDVAAGEPPRSVVAATREWQDDPLVVIARQVRATAERLGLTLSVAAGASLGDLLAAWGEAARAHPLLILDQFEEYFLYHPEESGPNAFADQLAGAVKDHHLRVSFLVSIREDALAKLDRFKGRIPQLFDNYLRVHHLSVRAAREAIERPLAQFNADHPLPTPVDVEPELVIELLADPALRAGEARIEDSGQGTVRPTADSGEQAARVEAPYLQLVMERLWQADIRPDATVLRLATLRRLGGAREIIRTHLDHMIGALPRTDARVAARVFPHLVTPSGTKIAYTVADLALLARVPEPIVAGLVERLVGKARVLRQVAPASGRPQEARYELFHDALAAATLNWRRRFLRRATQRRLSVAYGVATVCAVLAALALYWRHKSRRFERESAARAAAATAQASGEVSGLSLPLAVHAARLTRLAGDSMAWEAEDALRQALATPRSMVFRGHRGPVYAVALSPDGIRMATGAGDSTVRIWDAHSGQLLRTLPVQTSQIDAVAYSPDGANLAFAGADGMLHVWDVTAWKERFAGQAHTGEIMQVAYSPDGRWLATAGVDRLARVWDAFSGDGRSQFAKHGGSVNAVAFSPNSRLVVSGGDDSTARVWEAASGHELAVLSGHVAEVYGVAYSPTGDLIATASRDNTAMVWDARSGLYVQDRPRFTLYGHTNSVMAVAFNSFGTELSTAGADGIVRLWDPHTGREIRELAGHSHLVIGVEFNADGDRLATASWDGTARVWNLSPTGEVLAYNTGRAVPSLAWTDGGRRVLVPGPSPLVLDARTGTRQRTLLGRGQRTVQVVAAAQRGSNFAAARGDIVYIWCDRADTNPVRFSARHELIRSLAFTPDGSRLATGTEVGTVGLWNARTGDPLWTRPSGRGKVWAVAFSPDGRLLASAGEDKKVIIRTAESGQIVESLPQQDLVDVVAFSPDGQWLATGGFDWKVHLWSVGTWRDSVTFSAHRGTIWGLAFHPNGRWLASASFDRTVGIWDLTRRDLRRQLRISDARVYAVAYSPDGSRLATGDARGAVRVFTTLPSELLDLAYLRLTQELTSEECQRFTLKDDCPAPALRELAEAIGLAVRRDVRGALARLASARRLDPRLASQRLEQGLKRLGVEELLTHGEAAARDTMVPLDSAIAAYEAARELDSASELPPSALNNLCWFGSLRKQAARVLRYCDAALAIDAGDGQIRDTRGVARVLVGDTIGAIKDFQAYIDYSSADDDTRAQRGQRRRWIAALRAHRTPWTKQEFLDLMRQ